MTGSMSPRAKATLAAMRMAFKLANIARSFDIGHLAAFRARFERRAARLMVGPQHRGCALVKMGLLSWRYNPALLCMTFAFFEGIDGPSPPAPHPGPPGGDGLVFCCRPVAAR